MNVLKLDANGEVSVAEDTSTINQDIADLSRDFLIQQHLAQRQQLLAASDIWMLSDRWNQLTEQKQQQLIQYRQQLRDITLQPQWPQTVEWPQWQQN